MLNNIKVKLLSQNLGCLLLPFFGIFLPYPPCSSAHWELSFKRSSTRLERLNSLTWLKSDSSHIFLMTRTWLKSFSLFFKNDLTWVTFKKQLNSSQHTQMARLKSLKVVTRSNLFKHWHNVLMTALMAEGKACYQLLKPNGSVYCNGLLLISIDAAITDVCLLCLT